jgi:hypothetical protein
MVCAPFGIETQNLRKIKLLTDTKRLRNKGNLAFDVNFDTHLAKFNDWTGLLALLPTFLWPTLFSANDGDTTLLRVALAVALSYSLLGWHDANFLSNSKIRSDDRFRRGLGRR